MASAAVGHQRCHPSHLHLESLPLVDLRLLSQSELLSLSACSSSSASLPHADTDQFTPKIDRSVFNESAGSRKQTFYRLRLGAPRNNFSPSKPSAAPARLNAEPLGEENPKIVGLLKSLFNIPPEAPSSDIQDDEELVPVQIDYAGQFGLPSTEKNLTETAVLENIQVGVANCSTVKRKRGRPRKDETGAIQGNLLAIEGIKTPMPGGTAYEKVTSSANAGDLNSGSERKKRRGRQRKDEMNNSLAERAPMEVEGIKTPIASGSTNDKVTSDAKVEIKTPPMASGTTIEKVTSGFMAFGTTVEKVTSDTMAIGTTKDKVNLDATAGIKSSIACGTTNEKVNFDVNVGDLGSGSEQKKKRGRPRKNDKINSMVQRASMEIEGIKTPMICGAAVNSLIQGASMENEGIKTPMVCGTAENSLIQGASKEIEGIKTPMTCVTANEKVNTNANAGDLSSCSEGKKKRGRPRKNVTGNLLNQSSYKASEEIKTPEACQTANETGNLLIQSSCKGSEEIKIPMACQSANETGNLLIQSGYKGSEEIKIPMACQSANETGNLLIQSGCKGSEEIKIPMACQSANENGNTNANGGNITGFSEGKKKRGRPPKSANSKKTVESKESNIGNSQNERKMAALMPGGAKEKETEHVNGDLKEKEMVNVGGEDVDLVALRKADDFLRDELRRRTDGLGTEAELLEFLKRLDGEWGTKTEKKRIVDAGNFCNMLPKGWKLMLCARKRANNAWLACRRYISPNGRQFVSSKEVSLYLLSSFGVHDTSSKNPVLAADQVDFAVKPTSNNLPITSNPADHGKQSVLSNVKSTQAEATQKAATIKCHKCIMTFNHQDEFISHLISSHQGTAKGLGHGASTDIATSGKDGKYECQYCKEQFKEWHQYNSHLEVHAENYKNKTEGSAGALSLQKGSQPSSVGVPCEGSNLKKRIGVGLDSATKDVGTNSMGEKRDCNTGPLNMLGNEKIYSSQSFEKKNATSITREFEFNTVHQVARDDPKSGGSSCHSGPTAAVNDQMKKSCSEGLFPSRNANRVDVADGMKGTLTPAAVDSPWAASHLSEQARVINSTSNRVSTKIKDDPEALECSIYKNKDPIHFASNDNLKKPLQQRQMEAGLSSEQVFSYYNNVDRSSRGTIAVPKPKEAQSSSGFISAIGSNNNAFNASFVASAQPGRTKEGSHLVSNVNTQAFNNTFKETRQDRDRSRVPQSLNNDQHTNKTDLNVGYWVDSFHNNTDAGIFTGNKQRGSSFLGANEQNFAHKNDVPGVGGGSFHELQQKKNLLDGQRSSSFLGATEQKFAHRNDVPGVGAGRFHELQQKKNLLEEQRSSNFLGANEQIFARKNDVPGVGAGSFHDLQQKKNLLDEQRSSSFLGANEQKFARKNDVPGVGGSSFHELQQKKKLLDEQRTSSFLGANEQKFARKTDVPGVGAGSYHELQQKKNWLDEQRSSSFLAANEQKFACKNDVPGVGGGSFHELQQKKNLLNEQRSSSFLAANEQKFVCKNDVPGSGGGSFHELQQKKNLLDDLFGFSGNEQTHLENNLNVASTEPLQDGPRYGGFKNERDNGVMIGFGNNACPDGDAMTDFLWKSDDENGFLNGLADNSSQLFQSSAQYPAFDARPNKGASELFNVNEKFNSAPGFQGLRPGNYEHMEYNFLNAQTGSNSQNSKESTYNPQMTLGFGSSPWYEKEALPLLPKAALPAHRNQVPAYCSWCGNQFHNEAVGSEAVPMCPNCRVRFSTNHNFF